MNKLSDRKIELFEPFLWVFFIWYYLPIVRTFFMSDFFNLLFFGCFGIGSIISAIILIYRCREIPLYFTPLVPVMIYMVFFGFLTLFGIGDSIDHIRVSFSFWSSLITFYVMNSYKTKQIRLGRLFGIMFLITAITSIIGVIVNPLAARTLTFADNAIEEDIILRMLNIGGLAFFQGLVICVPILVTFICQKRYKTLSIIGLIIIFIGLFAASFTIALVLFFVALLLGCWGNSDSVRKNVILSALLFLIFVVPWSDLLSTISQSMGNETIALRLSSIADSFASGSVEGNLGSRFETYSASFNTFITHPQGVGPEYSFITFRNGIGYHSQILDDLARYGFWAFFFYIALFVSYYHLLKKQWNKVNMSQIALPVVLIYFIFLFLNPGFTSEHESVLLFYLIPVLPELISSSKKKQVT